MSAPLSPPLHRLDLLQGILVPSGHIRCLPAVGRKVLQYNILRECLPQSTPSVSPPLPLSELVRLHKGGKWTVLALAELSHICAG